jgi:uncharacterized membrane protein
VARIEEHLGLTPGAEDAAAPSPERARAAYEPAPESMPAAATKPPEPANRSGALLEAPETQGRDSDWLERFVGGRLFAVVGALVVIAGAGLGLKLAWDMGVFARLSDAGKSGVMGGFGALLLAAGAVSRGRWGRAAGEGFTAAGLGVLFATVYAMVGLFELLTPTSSLGALALVAALGFGISARGRYVVAPAVAVVGAFLVPVLTEASEVDQGVLAGYWLSVVATAYGLTAALGARMALARAAAWWLATIVGGAWAMAEGSVGPGGWPLAFLLSVWAIVHLELWRASAMAPGDDAWSNARLTRAIGAALTTTVWCVGLGMIALNRLTEDHHWILPAALAAASAVIARLVAPVGARLLRDPVAPLEKLGVALALQTGALIVTAVLIGGGDWTRAIATLAIGASAFAAAKRFESSWLRGYAAGALGVGVLCVVAAVHLHDPVVWSPGGLALTEWSALAALAALAWLISAWVERGRERGVALAAVAVGLLGASVVHSDVEGPWLAGAWAGLSALAVAAGRVAPELRTNCVGAMGFVISSGVWAAAYAPEWDTGPALFGDPGVHEGLLMALALVALMVAAAVELIRGRASDDVTAPFGVLSAIGGGVLLFAATSLEVSRLAGELLSEETARRAALSVWWGVFAIGVLALGRRLRLRPVRLTALALLGAATAKAVVWDLAEVAPGWRVASLLALGLFLLGVATAYARAEARLRSERSRLGQPGSTA